MTNAPPASSARGPWHRAPSITRLLAVTFVAVAVVGTVIQIAVWRSARSTQDAMLQLSRELDAAQRLTTSPAIDTQLDATRDLAAEAADDAIQAAAATTVRSEEHTSELQSPM